MTQTLAWLAQIDIPHCLHTAHLTVRKSPLRALAQGSYDPTQLGLWLEFLNTLDDGSTQW